MASTNAQHVWYASFGSNMCSERFACYLRGGKVEGMVKECVGARYAHLPFKLPPTPDCPVTSMRVPHRMFFAKSSPMWRHGGVAFLDVSRHEADDDFFTWMRLYRVSLDCFNDVLAQENGFDPRQDDAFERFSPEEVVDMGLKKSGDHRVKGTWYGYVQSLGMFPNAQDAEPILTFTLPPDSMETIDDAINPPSREYHDVIARGLIELGVSDEIAHQYLERRYTFAN